MAERARRDARPKGVVVALRSDDALTHLALLAISSRPPGSDQVALEVPEIERRRAGLSDLDRAWITISEYNYDVAERSYFLELGDPVIGRFGRAFMQKIAVATAELIRAGRGRIDRTR